MKITSLHDLLVEELRDLYSAENQLVKALPKLAKTAFSPDLSTAFQNHLKETQGQVLRLEKVFQHLEAKPRGKKCKAMEGLIEEGKEIMQEDMDESLMDAALIGAAQKVEHYEIAGYGTARTFAEILGYDNVVTLLQETLDEEAAADKLLTDIAENANYEAAAFEEA